MNCNRFHGYNPDLILIHLIMLVDKLDKKKKKVLK